MKSKFLPQEQSEVDHTLADDRARGRAIMSFNYWVRNKADPETAKLWSTEGLTFGQKRQVLTRWLIWKARGFSSDLEQKVTQSATFTSSSRELEEWCSAEVLSDRLGKRKAEALIEAGTFETRPCRFTGSSEPHMIEFKFVNNLKETVGSDSTALATCQTTSQDEEALIALKDLTQQPNPPLPPNLNPS